MVESVSCGGQEYAIIIRADYVDDGVKFFTPDDYSQQLAYMNRPAGEIIAPHVHNHIRREVSFTQEVLFIKSGLVRVDFYTNEKIYFASRELGRGDVILLATGGHGFEILENCEMIEVKQGPYSGKNDKTRFDPL